MSTLRELLALPRQIAELDRKVEILMSNQDTANELAASISEDVEVLARVSDQFVVANGNLKSQLAEAEAALVAAGVDFEPLRKTAGKIDDLANKLSAALSPTEPTPSVEEIETVEDVSTDAPDVALPVPGEEVSVPVEAPATEAPATEAPAAEAPTADAEAAAAEAAAADTTTGTDAGTTGDGTTTQ